MWKTGEEIMPPYGETVMYKLAKKAGVEEGICYLDKTNGNGHHFERVATISHGENSKQPYIKFVDGASFLVKEDFVGTFLWYDMIALNQAGLSQAELIRQPKEE
jgi:hypothetical protein